MKPAKLNKQKQCRSLEDELTISGKELLIIAIFVIIFGILCFICKGPTYGVL